MSHLFIILGLGIGEKEGNQCMCNTKCVDCSVLFALFLTVRFVVEPIIPAVITTSGVLCLPSITHKMQLAVVEDSFNVLVDKEHW